MKSAPPNGVYEIERNDPMEHIDRDWKKRGGRTKRREIRCIFLFSLYLFPL